MRHSQNSKSTILLRKAKLWQVGSLFKRDWADIKVLAWRRGLATENKVGTALPELFD
jgi:hypothetical protein